MEQASSADPVGTDTEQVMPPGNKPPGSFRASVADALDAFAQDRLLAELFRAHEEIADLEAAE
jgi:hypothetical protein